MINGSVLAPFRHHSTWPDDVLMKFRSAVYYHHAHVSGRDPVIYLRELILHVLRKDKPEDMEKQWGCLKDACDKVMHLAVKVDNDEEMANLVQNLLIFSNLLLIAHYGLESSLSLRFEMNDSSKQEEYDAGMKGAREKFMADIDRAYESLESAIAKLGKRGDAPYGTLKLAESADVLSPVPSSHHFIAREDSATIVFEWKSFVNGFVYEFRPHDPIGWVMTSGIPAEDRFADDSMSSEGGVAKN